MYIPNDDAIAYGWVTIVLFLIIGSGVFLAAVVGVQSELSPLINKDIADGKITQQQKNAIQFNRDMSDAIPIWMLLGAFVFVIVRSISRKT